MPPPIIIRYPVRNTATPFTSQPANVLPAGHPGTVALPDPYDVRAGVTYGFNGEYTGTLVLPPVSGVLDGLDYGGGGTEFEGTLVCAGGGGEVPPVVVPGGDGDHCEEFRNWVKREDAVLRRLRPPATTGQSEDIFDEYVITAAALDGRGGAKRRALTAREVYESMGSYSFRNTKWIVPKVCLPEGIKPRIKDQIADFSGQRFNILEVFTGHYGCTYMMITILEQDSRLTTP